MGRRRRGQVWTLRPRLVRSRGLDDAGRSYWRIDGYDRELGRDRTYKSLWATDEELRDLVLDIERDHARSSSTTDEVKRVVDMLDYWLGAIEADPTLCEGTKVSNRVIAKRAATMIGRRSIEELDDALVAYRDERLRAKAASSTVQRELRQLIAAANYCRRVKLLQRGMVPCPPVPSTAAVYEDRTPSVEEIRKVLAHTVGWVRAVLVLYATTGCRVSEIAKLNVHQVDLQNRTLQIEGKRHKGKRRPRVVGLSASAVAALEPLVRGKVATAAVWPVLWATVRSTLGSRYLARACEAASVPRFTPHGIRRRFAREAMRRVDVAAYCAALGHSAQVAIRHYQEVGDEELLALTDGVAEVLGLEGDKKPASAERGRRRRAGVLRVGHLRVVSGEGGR